MFQSFTEQEGFGRCGHRGGFERHWKHFRGQGPMGPFGFRGGGPMRARMFENGALRLVILQLIAEKPRHGYEIIKAIEEKFAGVYAPSPGVVYPTLTMLEDLGFVTVTAAEGNKKLYTITEQGSAELEKNKAMVDAVFERMEQAGSAFGHRRAPQIVRAVENLRTALRLKTGQGALTEEQIAAIAEALDQAAKNIERS